MLARAVRSTGVAGRRWIGGLSTPLAGPSVAERVVNVVLVDYEGNRHAIQGRAGQTLREACEMSGLPLVKDDSFGGGGQVDAVRTPFYTESLFGEGASSPQSHVVVANEWIHKLPSPDPREAHILETYVPKEDLSANSRLGTEIVLKKELDGLVVAVPEALPVETFVYDHEYDEDDFEEDP